MANGFLCALDLTVTKTLRRPSVGLDAVGRRTKTTFYSQSSRSGYLGIDTNRSYSYDSTKHRLTQIQREASASEKAQYAYDDSTGRVTKIAYGTGARAEYDFDASGALTQLRHYANGGTLIGSVAYQYGLAGNVTKATLDDSLTNNGDAVVTYEYDDLYRLTRENCTPDEGSDRLEYEYDYWYDAVGNRTKMMFYDSTEDNWYTTEYYYSPRNELTKTYCDDGDLTEYFEYDLRGNLTKRYEEGSQSSIQYYWSSANKLTKWYDGSKTVQYMYDFAGRRVAKKVDSGQWWWYFYDGLNVVAEGVASGNKAYYTNASGGPGGIICRDKNGTKLWYHFDRLGNVMAVTDSSGNAYAVYTMDAFGNVLEKGTSSGYASEHATDPQPYHLTTKEWDEDIGLYFFNVRWYDAKIGRWISREPTGADGPNLYRFCLDNPANAFDPDGSLTIIELGGGLILVCIVVGVIIFCARSCKKGMDDLGEDFDVAIDNLNAPAWNYNAWRDSGWDYRYLPEGGLHDPRAPQFYWNREAQAFCYIPKDATALGPTSMNPSPYPVRKPDFFIEGGKGLLRDLVFRGRPSTLESPYWGYPYRPYRPCGQVSPFYVPPGLPPRR